MMKTPDRPIPPVHPSRDAIGRQDFYQPVTYISGHRHPDTDSIVSAMAYEALKHKLGEMVFAVRLGDINPETACSTPASTSVTDAW